MYRQYNTLYYVFFTNCYMYCQDIQYVLYKCKKLYKFLCPVFFVLWKKPTSAIAVHNAASLEA